MPTIPCYTCELLDGQRIRFALKRRPGSRQWFACFRDADNKRRELTTGDRSKHAAEESALPVIRDAYAPKDTAQHKTWDEAVDLATRHMTAKNLRPGSIEQYLYSIRLLRRAYPKSQGPADITPRMAENYKLMRFEAGRTPRTIRNDLHNLSILYAHWWRDVCRILTIDPFADITAPKEDKKPPRIVEAEEKKAFFTWLQKRWPGWRLPLLFLEVQAAIGCRIGELSRATRDSLRENRITFTSDSTKGRRQRSCSLSPALFTELQALAGPTYVFERFTQELHLARVGRKSFHEFTPIRLVKWLQGEADAYFKASKAKKWKLHNLRGTAMSRARMAGIAEGEAAVAFGCNPETMRKHYLNLDEVAIADGVFSLLRGD